MQRKKWIDDRDETYTDTELIATYLENKKLGDDSKSFMEWFERVTDMGGGLFRITEVA